MKKLFESVGGRKLLLVALALVLAVVNEVLKLGISQETIQTVVWGSVGGSGTIALEDGLKALFPKKAEAKPDEEKA